MQRNRKLEIRKQRTQRNRKLKIRKQRDVITHFGVQTRRAKRNTKGKSVLVNYTQME